MTERQRSVLDEICRAFIAGQRHATLRELAESLGVSKSTVANVLNELEQLGVLTRSHGAARSLFVHSWRLERVCKVK